MIEDADNYKARVTETKSYINNPIDGERVKCIQYYPFRKYKKAKIRVTAFGKGWNDFQSKIWIL